MRGSGMGKRGILEVPYVVILTLLLCGLVLGFYIEDQDELKGSLVSPLEGLRIQGELDIFEMRERELIFDSFEESGFDAVKFEDVFISGLSLEMRDFLLEDLFYNGQSWEGRDFDEESFFDSIYSVGVSGENLVLKRREVGKKILLSAGDSGELDFSVGFEFNFDREYLVGEEDGEIFVEVLD